MLFQRKRSNTEICIKMDENLLERVKEVKYLGVILDENLNWKSHIKYLTSKITRASYILSKLRHYVCFSTLKMVYFSLVHPYLSYCISSWGGISKTTLLPLFRLQKKIVRIITFSPYDCHSSPLFYQLKILPLEYIYKYNLALTFHKINNNQISTGSHNLVPINQIHKHNTRLSKNNNFFQPFNRIRLGQTTYSTQGIKFWRELPIELKNLPFKRFKFNVKQFLLNLLNDTIN